jgi:hypothetical protein
LGRINPPEYGGHIQGIKPAERLAIMAYLHLFIESVNLEFGRLWGGGAWTLSILNESL